MVMKERYSMGAVVLSCLTVVGLDSLEPVCTDVKVPGAWVCVSKGGGFCSGAAELPFDCLGLLFGGSWRGVEAEECGLLVEGMGSCKSSLSVLYKLEESCKVVTRLEGWKGSEKGKENSWQRACLCLMSSVK